MSNSSRRYEILLPLRSNEGQLFAKELHVQTTLELENRFGAVSADTQTTRGNWQHEGQGYRDELVLVYVDVPDTPENREFFLQYKQLLKERFQQIEIRMTSWPIDVL